MGKKNVIHLLIFEEKDISDNKKTPRERWRILCRPACLCVQTGNSSLYLLVRVRSDWRRKQDPEMDGRVVMEPCSSHHWHHSDWPNSVRAPGLAATFPAHTLNTHTHSHTHTALFYLSGYCLLSFWLVALCLSACCPPHKPNNATLLGLLRLWPAAQWKKKRRRTWKRKSEEKNGPRVDSEAAAEIRTAVSGWHHMVRHTGQLHPQSLTLLESEWATLFTAHKSLQASPQSLHTVAAY